MDPELSLMVKMELTLRLFRPVEYVAFPTVEAGTGYRTGGAGVGPAKDKALFVPRDWPALMTLVLL